LYGGNLTGGPRRGKVIVMFPAKALIVVAGLVLAVGVVWWRYERSGGPGGALTCLGRLPGDNRIEAAHFRFYFPLTSCLLASIVVTVLVWLIRR